MILYKILLFLTNNNNKINKNNYIFKIKFYKN